MIYGLTEGERERVEKLSEYQRALIRNLLERKDYPEELHFLHAEQLRFLERLVRGNEPDAAGIAKIRGIMAHAEEQRKK